MAEHGITSHIIDGWSFNWTGIAQPGQPVTNSGSYHFFGDPKLATGQDLNYWFQYIAEHLGASPARHAAHLEIAKLDHSQRFETAAGYSDPQLPDPGAPAHSVQGGGVQCDEHPDFRAAEYDSFSPLFGIVPVTQANLPRDLEIGFRYSF